MRKLLPILVLAVACTKGESSFVPQGAAPDVARRSVAAAEAVAAPQEAAARRMIVRTADVRIVVADTAKAVDAITRSAEAGGGYVATSSIWRQGELLQAKLTLRVPAGKLTATLASIRGLAKRVENETVASDDVSQEYVDVESQVRNLEATEAELRELLKVARVNSKKASDVLEVHQQLTVIRGQIEQARGRMRYLAQVTAMASIALEVVPDAIAQPVVEPGWQPLVDARNASRALIGMLQKVVTAAIWFLIYVVPILGILLVAIGALVKLARRVRTA
jgi:hypothetical protein